MAKINWANKDKYNDNENVNNIQPLYIVDKYAVTSSNEGSFYTFPKIFDNKDD